MLPINQWHRNLSPALALLTTPLNRIVEWKARQLWNLPEHNAYYLLSTMLKNYFVITLRNLLKSSFINIVGLSIGITCSLLILLWVFDELSFDKFHPKAGRLYQVWVNARMMARSIRELLFLYLPMKGWKPKTIISRTRLWLTGEVTICFLLERFGLISEDSMPAKNSWKCSNSR